ncbi:MULTISPECIES: cupin domain-containing protein [unclassified Archaeoglobus]|jgi:quercetin dioxygenase-like cupin family protein|uniref:cupin domain-containing protein n=1 Tax=unclassified Archaeoglobus TaxID=2643606 RepID=UPI0025B83AD3|nr:MULTISPECIES: cupin domain-containing protein [unclassified Archaeoglobus]
MAKIFRKGERVAKEKDGVSYSLLILSDRLIAILAEIPPGVETPDYRHEGEEMKYILEGEIECISDDCKRTLLKPGDVIWHKPKEKHRVRNVGKRMARYIAVATRPSFEI